MRQILNNLVAVKMQTITTKRMMRKSHLSNFLSSSTRIIVKILHVSLCYSEHEVVMSSMNLSSSCSNSTISRHGRSSQRRSHYTKKKTRNNQQGTLNRSRTPTRQEVALARDLTPIRQQRHSPESNQSPSGQHLGTPNQNRSRQDEGSLSQEATPVRQQHSTPNRSSRCQTRHQGTPTMNTPPTHRLGTPNSSTIRNRFGSPIQLSSCIIARK